MVTMKIFTPKELKLTNHEERYLAEYCGGSSNSCFKTIEVMSEEFMREDYGDEYDDEESVFPSVNRKLLATGLVEIGETVMINLCW